MELKTIKEKVSMPWDYKWENMEQRYPGGGGSFPPGTNGK